MSDIIKNSAFNAGVSRLTGTASAVCALVRFAAMHGMANGQFTPATRLLAAISSAGIGGDLAKVTREALADAFKPFATVAGDTFTCRKGAEFLGTDGAKKAALALKGLPERIHALQLARATKKAEKTDAAEKASEAAKAAADDTATSDTDTGANALQERGGVLSSVLSSLTEAAMSYGKQESCKGANIIPFDVAADALARAMLASPYASSLFTAAVLALPALKAAADDTAARLKAEESARVAVSGVLAVSAATGATVEALARIAENAPAAPAAPAALTRIKGTKKTPATV